MSRSPLTSPKYVATVALASALILIVGTIFRPRARTTEAPQPSETDLARLTRLTERRSLDTSVDYFAGVADEVASVILELPDTHTSGVVWDTHLVAAPQPRHSSGASRTARAQSGTVQSTETIWAPNLPAAGMVIPDGAGLVPARRGAMPARSGSWLVAVWMTAQGHSFAPGHFVAPGSVTCHDRPTQVLQSTLSLDPSMMGGGVFDMDGALVALILPCEERLVAVVPHDVDVMLQTGASFEGRLLSHAGLVVSALTDEERQFFKAPSGVIVREVWTGRPADHAGLRPGDIIIMVNDTPVVSPTDLQALATRPENASLSLSARRGATTRTMVLGPGRPAGRSPDALGLRGTTLAWQSPASGAVIATVAPDSSAVKAGIRPGDQVLRVNQIEPRTLAQAEQLLDTRRRATIFVEVARGERRIGALLVHTEP